MSHDKMNQLIEALRDMPASGEKGFEGLIATLLGKLLDEEFVVARSGSQPGGDAHSVSGGVTMQAKRYKESTSFNLNEIEGGINQCLRLHRDLQCYVLATTRSLDGQTQTRLKDISNETGLDIVVLDHRIDGFSDLFCLCVTYWDSILSFTPIKKLEPAFQDWARTQSQTTEVKSRTREIEKRVKELIGSYSSVCATATDKLEERFGIKPSQKHFSYNINLEKSVRRQSVEKEISEWWSDANKEAACLEGEEGTGKSWAAALAIRNIPEMSNTLVLWMDSSAWCEKNSVKESLRVGFETIEPLNTGRTDKLVEKTLKRWKEPILIVFDGVNEKAAVKAANRILNDYNNVYSSNNDVDLSHIRLLFTSRLLPNISEYDKRAWQNVKSIPVKEYDDGELADALRIFDAQIRTEDIPESIKPYMKIPRYFGVCLKMRKRLGVLSNISKEIILWEDLKSRIDETDDQTRNKLGWQNERDAEDVLSMLAQNAVEIKGQQTAEKELLDKCFDNKYDSIRQHLRELRIAEKADKFHAILSEEHVKLGWALYILNKVGIIDENQSVLAVANDIRALLEPIPSDDIRTEALYSALLLSVNDKSKLGVSPEKKRAALLHCWLFSNNADINVEKLDFWANEDIEAYLGLIDVFSHELYQGELQMFIFYPLAKVWKQSALDIIKKHIEQWLLLVHTPNSDASGFYEYKGHSFPIAFNKDHLRLSALAVSLVSIQPDIKFLKALALSMVTWNLPFYEVDGLKRHPKDIRNNIGLIMRWVYTEKAFKNIQDLAAENKEDKLLLEGLQLLTRSLGVIDPPQELQYASQSVPWYETLIQRIENKEPLFEAGEKVFGSLNSLAARTDLPEIRCLDKREIFRRFEDLCRNRKPKRHEGAVEEDDPFDEYLPWVARYCPDELAELMSVLRTRAFSNEHPSILFNKTSGIYHFSESAQDNESIVDSIITATNKYISELHSNRAYIVSVFFESIILHAAPDKLKQWFELLSTDEQTRKGILVFDTKPLLMKYLLKSEMAEYAKDKTLGAFESCILLDEIDIKVSEFAFWSFIASSTHETDETFFEWAKARLIENGASHPTNYYLFYIAASRGSSNWLKDILNDDNLFPLIDERAVRAFVDSSKPFPSTLSTNRTYEELMRVLPKDFAGLVLAETGRTEDFNRWGRELHETVRDSFPPSDLEPESRSITEYILSRDGTPNRIRQNPPSSSVTFRNTDSATWGVDYGSDGIEDIEEVFDDSKREERMRSEAELWRKDLERINQWSYAWINKIRFVGLISEWAKRNEEVFVELAKAYLDRINRFGLVQHEMAAFTLKVLCLYIKHDPHMAWETYQKHFDKGFRRHRLIREYGTDEILAALWDVELCGTQQHDELRKKIFDDNWLSDMDVMRITLAAVDNGAEKYILGFVKKHYLSADVARERCLAVSVLPWLTNAEALDILCDLRDNDPNRWVRNHAEWACDVALNERCCRELYRTALREKEPKKMSATLQQIKPALSPAALLWKKMILYEEKKSNNVPENKTNYAIRLVFWSKLRNSLAKTKVNGRDIDKYIRGESIDSHRTVRLAPWWSVKTD
ncbi:MAG TPA: hypothetical protein PKH33_18280 [bacterium]|nr:hypothetical protein [bacterium]